MDKVSAQWLMERKQSFDARPNHNPWPNRVINPQREFGMKPAIELFEGTSVGSGQPALLQQEPLLVRAVRHGDAKDVQTVLSTLPDVLATGSNDDTALMVGASRGHAQLVKMLIDAGSDVNARNNDHSTALIAGASIGDIRTVKLLIDAGANVNARTDGSSTDLKLATSPGSKRVEELISELRSAGATR